MPPNPEPVVPQAVRDSVGAAVHAGRRARITQMGRVALPTGDGPRAYLVLVRGDGSLTDAGRYFYHLTRTEPPTDRAMDQDQEPERVGDSEFARDAQGRRVRLRTLGPDGQFTYTLVGRRFFGRRRVEYLVSVPVVIEGTRKNGQTYTRADYLPADKLGIGQIIGSALHTPAQRWARVKTRILEQLGIRTQGGRTVLLEISGETYYYDRTREWLKSELITTPSAHGPQVQALLRRPMGALRAAAAFIPCADMVLAEAWQERGDRLCVPRQLGVLLKQPAEDVAADFDRLLQSEAWRASGLSPADLRAYAKHNGHPLYVIAPGLGLIDSFEPSERRGRPLALCCFDGHAYFYRSAQAVQGWRGAPRPEAPTAEAAPAPTTARLSKELKHATPPFAQWLPWAEAVKPGHFWTDDLAAARRALLVAGRNPKITIRGLGALSSLRLRCVASLDGDKGECVIRERPPEAEAIQAWTGALNVEWCGERLPAATLKVLLSLLKARRREPGEAEKAALLAKQRHRCAECGGKFDDDVEFDHIAPLRQTAAGAEQRFQALCASCHAEKTRREGGALSLDSRFSRRAWAAYVETPRPPPLVWQPGSGDTCADASTGGLELDVRRCRRNAMSHAAHEWSVFSPLDSVVPSETGVLGDFSFVELRDARRSRLNTLPFAGNGWYHRVAVEFGLHHGVIAWGDIKWSFSATGRLPASVFEPALAEMEAAWGSDPEGLAKQSVNMMIGLWAIDSTSALSVKSSRDTADGVGAWARSQFEYGDGQVVVDHVFQTKLLTNASMRPIHDQIMHTEATRVAQLVYVVKALGVPPRAITDIKTDAVVLAGFAKKRRRALEAVEEVTFAELPQLRRRFEGIKAMLVENPMAGRAGDADKVFRLGTAPRRLQGVFGEPTREAPAPSARGGWTELAVAEAVAHAMAGKSLAVLGPPGTGKTYFVRSIVAALRSEGRRVDVVAKTHAACQNFGAGCVTADHFVRKYLRNGRCPSAALVVEEFSQISTYLWADLAKAPLTGAAAILVGDHAQLGAVCDTWAGSPVTASLERSDLFHELAAGHRVTLTENRRSDGALFDFYTSLRAGAPTERPLAEALVDARTRFPVSEEEPRYTLCLSHAARRAVNWARCLQEKPGAAVLFEAPDAIRGDAPEDKWLWAGAQVIGAGGKAKKGLLYSVKEVSNDGCVLSGGGDEARLTADQTVKCVRLSYAITYAACQGLTLPGRVRLIETESPHFGVRHLYVGASRATSASLLEVA